MSVWPNGCFAETHALVTGGTSGIGLAIAAAFLNEGAIVTATGVSLEEVASAAQSMPGLRTAVLDVRSAADIESLVTSLPSLHHVVNCAGIIKRGAEHDPEVFADVIDINLTGAWRMVRAVVPQMIAQGQGGRIVHVASVAGHVGTPG